MSAVANAFRAIAAGEGEIYIAGGVEHMTRSPYVMSKNQVLRTDGIVRCMIQLLDGGL